MRICGPIELAPHRDTNTWCSLITLRPSTLLALLAAMLGSCQDSHTPRNFRARLVPLPVRHVLLKYGEGAGMVLTEIQ
jgi:hypothetical protein